MSFGLFASYFRDGNIHSTEGGDPYGLDRFKVGYNPQIAGRPLSGIDSIDMLFTLDVDSVDNSPPGINLTDPPQMSVKFRGTLYVLSGCTPTFILRADDGVKLIIDGVTEIDFWNPHAKETVTDMNDWTAATGGQCHTEQAVILTAGRHDIEIWWYGHSGTTNLNDQDFIKVGWIDIGDSTRKLLVAAGVNNYLRFEPVAEIGVPYVEDFESETWGSHWTIEGTDYERVTDTYVSPTHSFHKIAATPVNYGFDSFTHNAETDQEVMGSNVRNYPDPTIRIPAGAYGYMTSGGITVTANSLTGTLNASLLKNGGSFVSVAILSGQTGYFPFSFPEWSYDENDEISFRVTTEPPQTGSATLSGTVEFSPVSEVFCVWFDSPVLDNRIDVRSKFSDGSVQVLALRGQNDWLDAYAVMIETINAGVNLTVSLVRINLDEGTVLGAYDEMDITPSEWNRIRFTCFGESGNTLHVDIWKSGAWQRIISYYDDSVDRIQGYGSMAVVSDGAESWMDDIRIVTISGTV